MNVYDYTNERLLLVKTSNPLLGKPSIMRRLGAALEGARQGYARSAVDALPKVSPAVQAIAKRPPTTYYLGRPLPERARLIPGSNFLSVPSRIIPAAILGLTGARLAMSPMPVFEQTREFYTGSDEGLLERLGVRPDEWFT